LKAKYDKLLSSFAFNLSLRHYSTATSSRHGTKHDAGFSPNTQCVFFDPAALTIPVNAAGGGGGGSSRFISSAVISCETPPLRPGAMHEAGGLLRTSTRPAFNIFLLLLLRA
jgi:hypothetical protein